jgi:hypothetical protein
VELQPSVNKLAFAQAFFEHCSAGVKDCSEFLPRMV